MLDGAVEVIIVKSKHEMIVAIIVYDALLYVTSPWVKPSTISINTTSISTASIIVNYSTNIISTSAISTIVNYIQHQ
ncbi:hypothetical protein RRG08_046696 [Elysia crispata]|uniref:Uncharacterized protein n=1 Tax=Elysia crispata TaxID=231223 RepID=A0AAE1AB27_9GAST|nr:hypothetical protein RRG08_046696 [Elysia crispata]